MTRKQLFEAIKSLVNPTEFETLGISIDSDKNQLETIYNGLFKKSQEPKEEPEPTNEQREEFENEKQPDFKSEEKIEPIETKPIEQKNDFDELLGKIKDATVPPDTEKVEKPIVTREKKKRKAKSSSPDSFQIQGYILLLAIDTVYPTVLSVANNFIDRKHRKITVDELRLTDTDFKKLEPLADQAADYLSFNMNPVAGFFLVATFMYANNMIAVKMELSTAKPDA